MPAQHRLRLHEHEVPAPVSAEATRNDPEQPIAPPEPWSEARAQSDGELLPQEQILEQEDATVARRGTEDTNKEREPIKHGVMMAGNATIGHAGSTTDGLLAPYRYRLSSAHWLLMEAAGPWDSGKPSSARRMAGAR